MGSFLTKILQMNTNRINFIKSTYRKQKYTLDIKDRKVIEIIYSTDSPKLI